MKDFPAAHLYQRIFESFFFAIPRSSVKNPDLSLGSKYSWHEGGVALRSQPFMATTQAKVIIDPAMRFGSNIDLTLCLNS
jgi:hypothetical protein